LGNLVTGRDFGSAVYEKLNQIKISFSDSLQQRSIAILRKVQDFNSYSIADIRVGSRRWKGTTWWIGGVLYIPPWSAKNSENNDV